MTALKILAFLAGAAVVLLTLRSAIRTFLVPRALQAYLARIVFVSVRRVFRLRAPHRHSYEQRDRIMAFYAPLSLVVLLGTWLVLVLAGFTTMFWGLGNSPVRFAFTIAGSSMFTLGFEKGRGLATTALSFGAAAIGLMLLALFITYLPSLYGAFQRREAGVAKLEVRAGQPPSGPSLIELANRVTGLGSLRELWTAWEDWFTDVDESHTTFPALVHFRSPHGDHSWITAAGAVLDGASLFASSVDRPRTPETDFMIRAGSLCLRHIADFLHIPVDHDPAPTDPISVTRQEFDAAYDRMDAAGVPMKPDRDRAWRDFAGWRVNYDSALIGLARLTMAPPAPWSSDRFADTHYIPRAIPWLRRSARRAGR